MKLVKIIILDEVEQPLIFYGKQDHDLTQMRASLRQTLSKEHYVPLSNEGILEVHIPNYLEGHVFVCLPLMDGDDSDESVLHVCRIKVQEHNFSLLDVRNALLKITDKLSHYNIRSSFISEISCDDYAYPQGKNLKHSNMQLSWYFPFISRNCSWLHFICWRA